MNKKLLLILAVLIAAAAVLWFTLKPAENTGAQLTLYGNVDIRQFDLGFQVPGQVTKMYFEEGDSIKQGSLIAEIDAALLCAFNLCYRTALCCWIACGIRRKCCCRRHRQHH